MSEEMNCLRHQIERLLNNAELEFNNSKTPSNKRYALGKLNAFDEVLKLMKPSRKE